MPHPTPQGETISAHETMSTDKTERAALLPCPMCGCAAIFVKHSAGMPGTQGFDKWDAVACKHCRTTVGACDRRFRCREDAAKAWNTRASQPATVVQPVARVNSEGFIVECGDLLLSPGMLLFSAPAESGWQWVPVEPAPAMLLAGLQCSQRNEAALYITELVDIYLAMLKAAPSAAQPGGADGGGK